MLLLVFTFSYSPMLISFLLVEPHSDLLSISITLGGNTGICQWYDSLLHLILISCVHGTYGLFQLPPITLSLFLADLIHSIPSMTIFPNLFCQEPTTTTTTTTTMLLQMENKTILLTQRPLGVSHADKMEMFRLRRVLLNFFFFRNLISPVSKWPTLQKTQIIYGFYQMILSTFETAFNNLSEINPILFEVVLKKHFFFICNSPPNSIHFSVHVFFGVFSKCQIY